MLQQSSPSFAAPMRVAEPDAHEGPVYVPAEDALYCTTSRPDVAIRRLALDGDRLPLDAERVTTVRASTEAANGMTLGHDGRLVVCEQGSPRRPEAITAVDPATGAAETIVAPPSGRPSWRPDTRTIPSVEQLEGYAVLTLSAGPLDASFAPGLGIAGVSLRHEGEELLDRRAGLRAYAQTRRHGHTAAAPMGEPPLRPRAFSIHVSSTDACNARRAGGTKR